MSENMLKIENILFLFTEDVLQKIFSEKNESKAKAEAKRILVMFAKCTEDNGRTESNEMMAINAIGRIGLAYGGEVGEDALAILRDRKGALATHWIGQIGEKRPELKEQAAEALRFRLENHEALEVNPVDVKAVLKQVNAPKEQVAHSEPNLGNMG
ncbi:MAG: hypothetical protein OEY94_05140 [Alphaproteobacteria bacterium]|nr:hypothetical protein [Alphaproteobacteria bacterium]